MSADHQPPLSGIASPGAHWKRRPKQDQMPPDQAVRQGDIARMAFQALGREEAIRFLNTSHPCLGGPPLAIAVADQDGFLLVKAELDRLKGLQADQS